MDIDIHPHHPGLPQARGIMFRDVTTLFGDGEAFRAAIDAMVALCTRAYLRIDKVAGIEARGFILGEAIMQQLGVGRLRAGDPQEGQAAPCGVRGVDYDLEYGKDRIEIHIDAVKHGDEVIIVDDLIATGGTAFAAIKLMLRLAGAKVIGTATSASSTMPGARRRRQDPRRRSTRNVSW